MTLSIVLLAGCGGSTGEAGAPPDPADTSGSAAATLVATARERAAEAGSFAFEMRMDMTPTDEGLDGTSVAASGVAGAGNLFRMTATVTAAGHTLEQQVLFDGEAFYIGGDAMAGLPNGARWMRLTLDDIEQQSGLDVSAMLEQGAQTDPRAILGVLEAMSDDVSAVGTETVAGVETTRYAGTVSRAALSEYARAFGMSEQQAAETLPPTIDTEVWIDADGLPRRVHQQFSATIAEMGGTVEFVSDMTFTEYGVELDLDVPADDEVLDLAEMLAG